jgi:hypothetical protein
VTDPASPFEQQQALLALEPAVAATGVSADDRQRMLNALTRVRGSAALKKPGTRRTITDRLLGLLDSQTG